MSAGSTSPQRWVVGADCLPNVVEHQAQSQKWKRLKVLVTRSLGLVIRQKRSLKIGKSHLLIYGAIREGLDQGLRPNYMKLSIDGILLFCVLSPFFLTLFLWLLLPIQRLRLQIMDSKCDIRRYSWRPTSAEYLLVPGHMRWSDQRAGPKIC
jgi:hypothetical protein